MKDNEKITCETCGHRLQFHYQYGDINKNSRYARCSMRPELKNRKNSSPKWCPLKKIQNSLDTLSRMEEEL